MSRSTPYTGPSDTSDFDHLTPEQASKLFTSYRLLGDCFEDSEDEDMDGRGWLIEDNLELLKSKAEAAAKARRELLAAVKLARYRSRSWTEIAEATDMTAEEVRSLTTDSL